MKKIYIKPLATSVKLNVSGSIMLSASQRTSIDDPNNPNKKEETIGAGGTTGGSIPWGAHAKQYSAWDTWDD